MAKKKDVPWWGNKHELWGGETYTSLEDADDIDIVEGDKFRIETNSNNKPTMIPHPENEGTWQKTHKKSNPIAMATVNDPRYQRTYRMMVTTNQGTTPKELFFIQQINGFTSITDDIDDPGTTDGAASVER